MVSSSPLDLRSRTRVWSAPNPTDTKILRSLISELEPRLELIELELQALLAEKERLSSRLKEAKSIFSPIRRLPEDILVVIFSKIAPYHTVKTWSDVKGDLYASIQISGLSIALHILL